MVSLWKNHVSAVNKKSADSLADPADYENLFPGLREAFKTEQYLKSQRERVLPAAAYTKIPVSAGVSCLKRMLER